MEFGSYTQKIISSLFPPILTRGKHLATILYMAWFLWLSRMETKCLSEFRNQHLAQNTATHLHQKHKLCWESEQNNWRTKGYRNSSFFFILASAYEEFLFKDCWGHDLDSISIESLDDVGICVSWCAQRTDCYGFVTEEHTDGYYFVSCYFKQASCADEIHFSEGRVRLYVMGWENTCIAVCHQLHRKVQYETSGNKNTQFWRCGYVFGEMKESAILLSFWILFSWWLMDWVVFTFLLIWLHPVFVFSRCLWHSQGSTWFTKNIIFCTSVSLWCVLELPVQGPWPAWIKKN